MWLFCRAGRGFISGASLGVGKHSRAQRVEGFFEVEFFFGGVGVGSGW